MADHYPGMVAFYLPIPASLTVGAIFSAIELSRWCRLPAWPGCDVSHPVGVAPGFGHGAGEGVGVGGGRIRCREEPVLAVCFGVRVHHAADEAGRVGGDSVWLVGGLSYVQPWMASSARIDSATSDAGMLS